MGREQAPGRGLTMVGSEVAESGWTERMTVTGQRLLRRAGAIEDGVAGVLHRIDAADAGWRYVGVEVRRLRAGDTFERAADDREVAVIALEGTFDIAVAGERFDAIGRCAGVFDEGASELVLAEPGALIGVRAMTDATVVVGDAPGASAPSDRRRATMATTST